MRKEILKLCYTAAASGCSRQVLKISVGKIGLDENKLEEELFYLKEKELIRAEHIENKRLGIQRDVYFITAAGMDYLDGNGPDVEGIGV